VLVDECHRTQEKDLGAFLQATLPDAHFYGFTGTPIKSTDKDTYARFSIAGEGYLDKYGIDDAVRDGATVPILYEGRKADWSINEAEIDILFDRWFVDLPDDKREELKRKGLTLATIAKHPERIRLIALDIWEHFKAVCQPDRYKAQVVAVDREAVVLYRAALAKVIAADLAKAAWMKQPHRRRPMPCWPASIPRAKRTTSRARTPKWEHCGQSLRPITSMPKPRRQLKRRSRYAGPIRSC
jgi:type I restriction enzyme R subunit